ncbi:MAG: helix-turn-helix transcriptional regulator, partial [Ruminococcus sp.]|nr:helix-turn-helix transcriptional regulator [Ruminococcus sp.]
MQLNIGENIKRFRKERNITQEELSEILGVSFQSVSRWEN